MRLVANVVEKDLRRVHVGSTRPRSKSTRSPARSSTGRVARVAPVLDPATRTAQMEIEVPNGDFRLKPGMYSRVRLTVATKAQALTVPVNAVVDLEGKRGVFQVKDGTTKAAAFVPVETGIEDGTRVEVLDRPHRWRPRRHHRRRGAARRRPGDDRRRPSDAARHQLGAPESRGALVVGVRELAGRGRPTTEFAP